MTENPVHRLVPGDEGYDLHLTTDRGALKRVDLVNPHLNITPNTVVTTYDLNDEGVRPRTDVYLRPTFFLNLE